MLHYCFFRLSVTLIRLLSNFLFFSFPNIITQKFDNRPSLILVKFLWKVLSVNILMCYFIIDSFFKIFITTSSVSSWLSSSIPCIQKQFLLEYCSYQSKALPTFSGLAFTTLMVSFSSTIYSFFFPIHLKFSNFLSIFYSIIHFLQRLSHSLPTYFNLSIIVWDWKQVYFADFLV